MSLIAKTNSQLIKLQINEIKSDFGNFCVVYGRNLNLGYLFKAKLQTTNSESLNIGR